MPKLKTRVKVPKLRLRRPSSAIRRILERDPSEQILNALEEVQGKADFKLLRRVTRETRPHVRGGWIHVTDAMLPCDRLLAGSLLGVQPPAAPVPPKTRRIWDNGTYMHLRYQCYFRCLPRPFVVEAPKLLRYWPIVGEADVALEHPDIGKWVIELKSMNAGQWRLVHAPKDSHHDQANGYVAMSGEGWGGQVWYENKNNQDLKKFVMELDRSTWEAAWRRASAVAGAVLAGDLPAMCPTCPDVAFCEDNIRLTDKALEVIHEQRAISYPSSGR
ncbi:hypothetical protein LCGC14_1258990 [marine sediment metagenome]|uniref:PD-(D/E)XK endonuclease-like domain-containing protein n=1 Tax=marine sediment metagenome TaxID=412755 RepID=A0A0F9L1A9_9ZZZZ